DPEGNLWIGSAQTVTRWRPGASSVFRPKGLANAASLSGVQGIALESDASIWIGMNRTGPGLGLEKKAGEEWLPFTVPGFDGTGLGFNVLLADGPDAFGTGIDNQGIYRIYGGKVDLFATTEGFSSNTVRIFFKVGEGNLWFLTAAGVDCFRNTRVI